VPIVCDQIDGKRLIRLEGAIDISLAAQLKALLLESLFSEAEIQVDVQRATEVDITALQLLWAAARAARESGIACTLVGCIPKEISETASGAGFDQFPIPFGPK
jgi:anti-anti-sigma regulatory factor